MLIKNGCAHTARAYILYRDEPARDERARRSVRLAENIPWRKIWEVPEWALSHDLHTVERLNAHLERRMHCCLPLHKRHQFPSCRPCQLLFHRRYYNASPQF